MMYCNDLVIKDHEPCLDFFCFIGIGVTTGLDELFFNVMLLCGDGVTTGFFELFFEVLPLLPDAISFCFP